MSLHQRRANDSGLTAIMIEGGLISPAQLALIAATPPDLKTAADYNCPKGTNLRDEITRYFRIAQAHWQAYSRIESPNAVQVAQFARAVLEGAFGFDHLTGPHRHTLDDHTYRIALDGKGGRVPVVVAAPLAGADDFNKSLLELGDEGEGTIARRSPVVLLQDWLNANDQALWGLCFAGDRVRLMRDNASLTRQSYIEADLGAIFKDEIFSDFTALWLLIHATRFGGEGAAPTDCKLEQWREAGQQAGTTARQRLGANVEEALLALGQGFLDANPDIRARLDDGSLQIKVLFEQILRIVYRLIFLAVAEDRDLLHPRNTATYLRDLYCDAYGFDCLRERAGRRSAHDHHADAWEGVLVTFKALEYGEKQLGLPALGGLFSSALTPDLNIARLPNKALLTAIFRLSFLIDKEQRVRINWRDMATEELGSVYEGLLELVPIREDHGRKFSFASGNEQKGNARKLSSSYYTPDSLVQALLDSALDPVLDRAESEGGAEGILKLSVIDPACGSGHFLLGAARRMATRVAQVRNPDAPDYNAAMRDVVRNAIYGVDRNPMAVELTKVALWIETVEPGKPLGFLDVNIRCGDSLLGVFDLSILENGIPDAAYKALIGDDKDACNVLMKVNRNQRDEKWADLSGHFAPASAAKAARRLHDMAEDNSAQLKAKRDAFEALRGDEDWWSRKLACNLYIAAFLRPKRFRETSGYQSKSPDLVPTTHDVKTALSGAQGNPQLTDSAVELAGEAAAFHWPLEFPDIFATGGFDVVLGNPPWERVKLQEEEFFALRDPEIATAKNAAARKKLIAQLPDTNPQLANEFQKALRTAATESHFMRESGRFPLGGVGDVNTYAVFTDLAWRALHPRGRAGLIIPNGLVVGFTYREFLRQLLAGKSLVSFFGFENEDKLFQDVHNETKFGLLTIGGADMKIEQPWFTAHIRQPTEITDLQKRYALTVDEIRAINPNTLNLPAFRWSNDAKVTASIHTAAPILIAKQGSQIVQNDWRVSFKTMFHMAGDSGHFIDHQDVASRIIGRQGALALLDDGRQVYPLYEGKMFWHFDHRYGTYESQTEKQENKGVLPRVLDEEHRLADYRIEPRYWVDARLTNEALAEDAGASWLFSWRDVGPSERTFIGTILPKTAMGHASPYLTMETPAEDALAFSTVLSSLVVDYAARQKSSRMTFFIIEQLPVLKRSTLGEVPLWLGEKISVWLNKRAIELFYTNWELQGFAKSLGMATPPFRWEPARRRALQAEIDAAILHLYGLDRQQADWILDSFTVLRKYEERDHGEYRTKRLVLKAYDAMADAKASGISYQTTLSPVPADPGLCHSAQEITATLVFDPTAEPIDAWKWPAGSGAADTTLPQLAAIIKALPVAMPASTVRLAAIFALQPKYLTRQLKGADRSTWLRLVGLDAQDSGSTNVVAFRPRIDMAWKNAVAQLIGMGALIDNVVDGTWALGTGLEKMPPSAWSDGRARFALQMIQQYGLDKIDLDLAAEDIAWVATDAA
jgi:hypothetical protein